MPASSRRCVCVCSSLIRHSAELRLPFSSRPLQFNSTLSGRSSFLGSSSESCGNVLSSAGRGQYPASRIYNRYSSSPPSASFALRMPGGCTKHSRPRFNTLPRRFHATSRSSCPPCFRALFLYRSSPYAIALRPQF